jgi:hypothetical protein
MAFESPRDKAQDFHRKGRKEMPQEREDVGSNQSRTLLDLLRGTGLGEFSSMRQRTLLTNLALIVVAGVVLSASSFPAMAQSCALCYTQAASAGGRMIQALKSGILILVVPPTLTSIGMVFVMYRNRNRCRDEADTAGIRRDLE